jgi:2-hydroxychromene-2-carboxylate isomerase
MSLTRRWLDPIRSRWLLQRPTRTRRPSARADRGTLTVFLRFDDAYSYLLVQILAQLDSLLIPRLRPLKIIIATQAAEPDTITAEQWLRYTHHDAAVLAHQHRFVFQENYLVPTEALMKQAQDILSSTPLQGAEFLRLLQNIFHMIWQHQNGKLALLHQMAIQRKPLVTVNTTSAPNVEFSDEPLSEAYIAFAGRHYLAIDDFLRLTRRLQHQHLLTGEPVFLINHVEWGEHLVNDPILLADIQAMRPVLKFYGALEDPFTYLVLRYLQQEMVGYYNVKLKFFPLPYQGRDDFDWRLAMRLSKRVGVPFSPFCRPDAAGVMAMTKTLVNLKHEPRLNRALQMLEGVWSQGLDMDFLPHFSKVLPDVAISDSVAAVAWLERNQSGATALGVPDLPAFELRVAGRRHVFCSLYRVWQVETLLSAALEDV